MYLLQAVEPPPPPTGNSTTLLYTAIIAGVVAIVVAYITNWRADAREVEKTRREVLSTAVAIMVQKSEDRHLSISENSFLNHVTDVGTKQRLRWGRLEQEMKVELVKVQIHASDTLYDAAEKLYNLHSMSDFYLMMWELGESKYPTYEIDNDELQAATKKLIQQVRIEAKLNKRKLGSKLKSRLGTKRKQSPDENDTEPKQSP